MKYHIVKNSVQETLVIPLYGRKLCTERFPNLFQDRKAVELILMMTAADMRRALQNAASAR